MNLYISDLHLGHKNSIEFDNRPFVDIEEMDRHIIENWNAKVTPEDHVYVIGDFSYRSKKSEEGYLSQLQGHKHLVIGNHDLKLIKNDLAMSHFETVDKLMYIRDGAKIINLCHYPMAEWNGSRHGSWLIYGHIHGTRNDVYHFMQTRAHALNAAACINNYTPASFEELIENNKRFQKEL